MSLAEPYLLNDAGPTHLKIYGYSGDGKDINESQIEAMYAQYVHSEEVGEAKPAPVYKVHPSTLVLSSRDQRFNIK